MTATRTALRRVADGPWTPALAAIRLAEAQQALRTAKIATRGFGATTWWPSVLLSPEEAHACPIALPRNRATSAQLGRMDETLQWVSKWLCRSACEAANLPRDAGWLVWVRAGAWSYDKIARARVEMWAAEHLKVRGGQNKAIPGGNSRPSLVIIEEKTLRHLAEQLNRATVPVDADTAAAVSGGRNQDGRAG